MFYTSISCSQCKTVFQPGLYNTQGFVACPRCLTPSQISVFPAFFRSVEAAVPAARLLDSESSCFYHADKQAVIPCDLCGRFLCALCDMEFAGQHVCPACLEQRKKKGTEKKLEARFVQYDQIALSVAVLPLLLMPFWFMTLLTAPAALYIVIRHWKTPLSILPRSRARMAVAGLIAVAEIIGWIVLLIILLDKLFAHV